MRLMSIIKDKGFKTLMKTGCPNYKLPKQVTIARDVKQVFMKTKKRVAKHLQVRIFIGISGLSNELTRNMTMP
jgi:hypothetical protein